MRGSLKLRAGWIGPVFALVLFCITGARGAEPHVIMLRGWFGVFSTGLDGLAGELAGKGIKAEVVGCDAWSSVAQELLQERAAGKVRPIVLVGHSQGANNIIEVARTLEAHDIPVDLIVTIAPFLARPIPKNIVHAIDYYQAPGWGSPLKGVDGFHGTLHNVNVFDDWTTLHITIDKSARIHNDIVREIVALSERKDKVAQKSRAPRHAAQHPQSIAGAKSAAREDD